MFVKIRTTRLQKCTYTTVHAPTKKAEEKQGDKHLPTLVLGTDDRYIWQMDIAMRTLKMSSRAHVGPTATINAVK